MYRRLTALIMALSLSLPVAIAREDRLEEAVRECKAATVAADKARACTVVISRSRDKSAVGAAHNRRGHANVELKRYAEAVRDFSEVIRLNPTVAGYYDNRQYVLRQLGRLDEALQDANAAVRLAPTYSFVLRGRANVYDDMGKLDLAIADFTRGIAIDPKDAGLRADRAKLYAKARRDREAVADLTDAFELNPSFTGLLRDRGLARVRLGEREAAKADLAAYLKAEPGDLDAALALSALTVTAVSSARPEIGQQTPAKIVSTPSVSATLQRPENRIALVIANSEYAAVSHLQNPRRDAEAIAEALKTVGFRTVTLKTDLGFDAMRRALSDFSAEAERADWALVYFAGHGIELAGTNYLVPVDARLRSDRAALLEAVSLDKVIGSIEGASKLRMIILDACRDNPFLVNMSRSEASRSVGRGLARVEPGGSTLVAYSAKAGQVASDGAIGQQNSPFAAALVKALRRPNVEIRKFFGLIRDDVLEMTDRRQDPAVYGSLGGDDYIINASGP